MRLVPWFQHVSEEVLAPSRGRCLLTFPLQRVYTDHSGVTDLDWMPLWNYVGRGVSSIWGAPGLCIHPQTYSPIPVGAECANKSAYDTFIEGCLRRTNKRPCLCSCGETA